METEIAHTHTSAHAYTHPHTFTRTHTQNNTHKHTHTAWVCAHNLNTPGGTDFYTLVRPSTNPTKGVECVSLDGQTCLTGTQQSVCGPMKAAIAQGKMDLTKIASAGVSGVGSNTGVVALNPKKCSAADVFTPGTCAKRRTKWAHARVCASVYVRARAKQ